MSKKQTVGKAAVDLLTKNPYAVYDLNAREITEQVMQNDYPKVLFEALEAGKKEWDDLPFYIEIIKRAVKVLPNSMRLKPHIRLTCPRPAYDHDVYYYDNKRETLEELWAIPDKITCDYLLFNEALIPDNEKQLLLYVKSFINGTLDNVAYSRDQILKDQGVDISNASILKKGVVNAL